MNLIICGAFSGSQAQLFSRGGTSCFAPRSTSCHTEEAPGRDCGTSYGDVEDEEAGNTSRLPPGDTRSHKPAMPVDGQRGKTRGGASEISKLFDLSKSCHFAHFIPTVVNSTCSLACGCKAEDAVSNSEKSDSLAEFHSRICRIVLQGATCPRLSGRTRTASTSADPAGRAVRPAAHWRSPENQEVLQQHHGSI